MIDSRGERDRLNPAKAWQASLQLLATTARSRPELEASQRLIIVRDEQYGSLVELNASLCHSNRPLLKAHMTTGGAEVLKEAIRCS